MRTRYIPDNATELKDEQSTAVVYLANHKYFGLIIVGYCGKTIKPDINMRCQNEEHQLRQAAAFFDKVRRFEAQRASDKAARKAARDNYMPFAIGDILDYTWGYEQTNVEFYQVTAVNGKTVTLTPISHETHGDPGYSSMAGNATPIKDKFCGTPINKRMQGLDGKTIVSFEFGIGYLWNGKPVYESWYA